VLRWGPRRPSHDEAAELIVRIADALHRGGMGGFLAARDLNLDREVAIKILLPGDSRTTNRRRVPSCGPTWRRC
jgi:hypothetical protein